MDRINCFSSVVGALLVGNLIANGDFSKYNECPEDISQFDKVNDWINPSKATPDFYINSDSCQSEFYLASQCKEFDNGYSGIILYSKYNNDYREYIVATLNEPLEKNDCYTLCFDYSWPTLPQIHLDRIEFKFFKSRKDIFKESKRNKGCFKEPSCNAKLNVEFKNCEELRNASVTYLAEGGEEYILVGILSENEDLNIIHNNSNSIVSLSRNINMAYILLDNFVLFKNKCFSY